MCDQDLVRSWAAQAGDVTAYRHYWQLCVLLVLRDEDGELVIPPLTAESVPAEADTLRDELVALLPRPRLASLLIELDNRIGFTEALVHAGGETARNPELVRNILPPEMNRRVPASCRTRVFLSNGEN